MDELFQKMQKIIAEKLEKDESQITLDSSFRGDLGADSLDAIDIVMSVEDEFEIEIPDEIVEKMESVSDIVTYVENNI